MPIKRGPSGKFLSAIEQLRQDAVGGTTAKAVRWYSQKISQLNPSTYRPSRLMEGTPSGLGALQSKFGFLPGDFYLYFYDPKTKDKLPYYDIFPLVMPFDIATNKEGIIDGFVGINFHYLPPMLRMKLFAAVKEHTNNDRFDDKTRVMLTWNTLRHAAAFPGILSCVKRYLFSHIQSSLLKINPFDWKTAIMLPVQQFQKTSTQTVWRHSVERV